LPARPAYVCARDVNGIFVLTLLARSFVRWGTALARNDRLPMSPRVYPPRIHLGFLSERKSRVSPHVSTPRNVDAIEPASRINGVLRCIVRVNSRVRNNERNERSVSNGWTCARLIAQLLRTWGKCVNAGTLGIVGHYWKISRDEWSGISENGVCTRIIDTFYNAYP